MFSKLLSTNILQAHPVEPALELVLSRWCAHPQNGASHFPRSHLIVPFPSRSPRLSGSPTAFLDVILEGIVREQCRGWITQNCRMSLQWKLLKFCNEEIHKAMHRKNIPKLKTFLANYETSSPVERLLHSAGKTAQKLPSALAAMAVLYFSMRQITVDWQLAGLLNIFRPRVSSIFSKRRSTWNRKWK